MFPEPSAPKSIATTGAPKIRNTKIPTNGMSEKIKPAAAIYKSIIRNTTTFKRRRNGTRTTTGPGVTVTRASTKKFAGRR